jgi:hypothetical protein
VTSTNLRTEFLPQFQKEQEHSTILLASNRPQQGQDKKTKNDRKGKQKLNEGKQGKTMNKWAYKKLPTYKTQRKIILKMPKVEIPNRNFSLISNPLVHFRRIFEG